MPESWDDEFEALATKEAGHRIMGASDFATEMRKRLVEMAEWASGIADLKHSTDRENRCPKCGGLNGAHGLVHTRHGNGGGSNSPCPNCENGSER